jgi:hypothetical protein
MARIDWKEEKPSGGSNESMSAGVYHVEVADAEERVSQSGDAYFSIRLKDLESGRIVCFDIIMLAGKGLGIGLSKLSKLGFDKDDDEIVAAQLIGRRAWVGTKEESYNGKERLVVDIKWAGSSTGYFAEDEYSPDATQVSGGSSDSLEDPPF